jgi:hypothetical protein
MNNKLVTTVFVLEVIFATKPPGLGLNSALAGFSFLLSSFQNFKTIGGPVVTMWWTTS